MEQFSQFLEMPMGHFGHQEFIYDKIDPPKDARNAIPEAQPHFNWQDRAIITNKSMSKKLEQILNKTKWTWNIIFIENNAKSYNELPLDKQEKYYNSHNYQKLENKAKKYLSDNKIPTKDRITFVKNSSTGHPLSTWMTLHTIGHAIGKESTMVNDVIYILTKLIKRLGIDNHSISRYEIYHLINKFFLFNSAQTNKKGESIGDNNELVYELFAEYLWHGGKIRINPAFSSNILIVSYIKNIEDTFSSILDKLVGKIIKDEYLD